MARSRDYAAEYQRRVARAQEAGFSGYGQQRAVKKWMEQNVKIESAARRAGVQAAALRALRRARDEGRRGTTSDILDDWRQKVRRLNSRLGGRHDKDSWAYYHV